MKELVSLDIRAMQIVLKARSYALLMVMIYVSIRHQQPARAGLIVHYVLQARYVLIVYVSILAVAME
jgi:hypothetical protein